MNSHQLETLKRRLVDEIPSFKNDSSKTEDKLRSEIISQVMEMGTEELKIVTKILNVVKDVYEGTEKANPLPSYPMSTLLYEPESIDFETVDVSRQSTKMEVRNFIEFIQTAKGEQKKHVEKFIEKFFEYPKEKTPCLEYAFSEDGQGYLSKLKPEQLKGFLVASIITSVITSYLSLPKLVKIKKEERLRKFISLLNEHGSEVERMVKEKEESIENSSKQTWTGMAKNAMSKLPWNGGESTEQNSQNSILIKEIQNLSLSKEQFTIAFHGMKIVPMVVPKNVSAGSDALYPSASYYPAPAPITPQMKKELNKCVDGYDQKIKQTRGNFESLMNQRHAVVRQPTLENSVPPVRQEFNAPKSVFQEDLLKIAARKEDQRRFENELNMRVTENSRKEENMREEKTRNDEKTDMEFQQVLDKQKQENEEINRRIQKEIEDYEKETQRLLSERIRNWQACNDALFQCLYLKQLFEDRERELAQWLKTLSDSVSNVNTRFNLFERVIRNISKSENSYGQIFMNELGSLHKSALSSYELLFDACNTVKKLDAKFPDGVFLHILHKSLVVVTNKLSKILLDIDQCMEHPDNAHLKLIHESFSALKSSEIPSTWQLREESKRGAKYTICEEPRVYIPQSSVKFEELQNEPEVTEENLFETPF